MKSELTDTPHDRADRGGPAGVGGSGVRKGRLTYIWPLSPDPLAEFGSGRQFAVGAYVSVQFGRRVRDFSEKKNQVFQY